MGKVAAIRGIPPWCVTLLVGTQKLPAEARALDFGMEFSANFCSEEDEEDEAGGLFPSEYPEDQEARRDIRNIEGEMVAHLLDPLDDRKQLFRRYLLDWPPDKGCRNPHCVEVL